jgi:hypothetical protein
VVSHSSKRVVTALTGRPSTKRHRMACVSARHTPSQASAVGSGSCVSAVSCPKRSGAPAVQACRCGWARGRHHTSSANPNTHSGGSWTRRIRRSHAFFFEGTVAPDA